MPLVLNLCGCSSFQIYEYLKIRKPRLVFDQGDYKKQGPEALINSLKTLTHIPLVVVFRLNFYFPSGVFTAQTFNDNVPPVKPRCPLKH